MILNGTNYIDFIRSFDGAITPFPSIRNVETEGRVIYLRHDIDGLLENSVRMAKLEYENGIKSVYFVLDTASYFAADIGNELRQIRDYGHEIGWHNNALQSWYLDGMKTPLVRYINEPLKKIRGYGCRVRGTAAHYVSAPNDQRFRNYNIWALKWGHLSKVGFQKFNLLDFGLEYEAYFIPRDIYLCDSGNRWNVDPAESAKKFNEAENSTIQILIHPQWWH